MKPDTSDAAQDAQAHTALNDLLAQSTTFQQVHVHLASCREGTPDYRWLPLKKPDGKKLSAVERFATVLARGVGKLGDDVRKNKLRPVRHHTGVAPSSGQLEYVHLRSSDGAPLRKKLAPLLKGSPFPSYDAKDPGFLDHLCFSVISVPGLPLRSFRAMSPKMQLGRSLWFTLVGSSATGAYDLLRDRALMFDSGVDCLLWGEWLFILNRTPFQQMFGYYQVLEQRSKRTVAALDRLDVIKHFDRFAGDTSRGIAQKTKLDNIADGLLVRSVERPVAEREGPPKPPRGYWDRVEATIEMFDLGVEVVGTGDDRRFDYDPDHLWELLALLDDDFLVSPQAPQPTSRGYRAEHKRPRPLRVPVLVQEVGEAAGPLEEPAVLPAAAERKGPHRIPREKPAAAETKTETA